LLDATLGKAKTLYKLKKYPPTLLTTTCISFVELTSLDSVKFVAEPVPLNESVPAIKLCVVGVEPMYDITLFPDMKPRHLLTKQH
jgi:hypothetical protein